MRLTQGFMRFMERVRQFADERELVDVPRRFEIVVNVGVCVLVVLASVAVEPRPIQFLHAFATALAALCVVGAVLAAFVLRRRHDLHERQAIALVLGAGSLALSALDPALGPGLPALFLTMVWASRIGVVGPPLALITSAAFLVLISIQAGRLDPFTILFAVAALAWSYFGPLLGGRARRRRDERLATEERQRLAREVHDVLAHTLTALSVQLEGARMLLEVGGKETKALEAVDRAQHLALEGLEETRQAVAALRGDQRPGPESLAALVSGFERETGVPTHVSIEGTPVALNPDAGLALYRTAQEALTNVRKHADADEVVVQLRYATGGATLTVSNRGRQKPAEVSGGFGLTGLRERAGLVGGILESGPTSDGFAVSLWVPI